MDAQHFVGPFAAYDSIHTCSFANSFLFRTASRSNVNFPNSLRRYRRGRFDYPLWNHMLLYMVKIVPVRQFICPRFESPAAVFFLLDEIPSLKSAESVLLYVVTLPWLHWNMAWVFLQNFSIEDSGFNNVLLQKRQRQEQAQFIS
jgi:hypothetical protein